MQHAVRVGLAVLYVVAGAPPAVAPWYVGARSLLCVASHADSTLRSALRSVLFAPLHSLRRHRLCSPFLPLRSATLTTLPRGSQWKRGESRLPLRAKTTAAAAAVLTAAVSSLPPPAIATAALAWPQSAALLRQLLLRLPPEQLRPHRLPCSSQRLRLRVALLAVALRLPPGLAWTLLLRARAARALVRGQQLTLMVPRRQRRRRPAGEHGAPRPKPARVRVARCTLSNSSGAAKAKSATRNLLLSGFVRAVLYAGDVARNAAFAIKAVHRPTCTNHSSSRSTPREYAQPCSS
jgi:hypothetical protein